VQLVSEDQFVLQRSTSLPGTVELNVSGSRLLLNVTPSVQEYQLQASSTQSASTSLSRAISRFLSSVNSVTGALVRAISRSLSNTQDSSSFLSVSKVYLVALSIVQGLNAGLIKDFVRSFQSTQDGASAQQKNFFLALAQTQSADDALLKLCALSVGSIQSTSASIIREIQRLVSSIQSVSSGLQKTLSLRAEVLADTNSFLSKGLQKISSVLQAGSSVVEATRVVMIHLLSTQVTSTVLSVQSVMNVALAAMQSVSLGLGRQINRTLSKEQTSLSQCFVGFFKQVAVTQASLASFSLSLVWRKTVSAIQDTSVFLQKNLAIQLFSTQASLVSLHRDLDRVLSVVQSVVSVRSVMVVKQLQVLAAASTASFKSLLLDATVVQAFTQAVSKAISLVREVTQGSESFLQKAFSLFLSTSHTCLQRLRTTLYPVAFIPSVIARRLSILSRNTVVSIAKRLQSISDARIRSVQAESRKTTVRADRSDD
jgi:hypothetical protein